MTPDPLTPEVLYQAKPLVGDLRQYTPEQILRNLRMFGTTQDDDGPYLPAIGDTVRQTFKCSAVPVLIEGIVTRYGPNRYLDPDGPIVIYIEEPPSEHYPRGYGGYWDSEGWEKVA